MTVAGIPGDGSTFLTSTGVPITTDPLYVYDNGTNGNTATLSTTTLADFVDYASLVRTGTGNINIATSKDLVLQSPLSLIYTAGTGDNINGSASQPLAGFTQYNGNPEHPVPQLHVRLAADLGVSHQRRQRHPDHWRQPDRRYEYDLRPNRRWRGPKPAL